MFKCEFGLTEILYLGHKFSAQGIHVNEQKILAIQKWLIPTTLTDLRGFLGFSNYYRRFIRGFSQLVAPLTELTKKEAFQWNETTKKAFGKMKSVMICCPV